MKQTDSYQDGCSVEARSGRGTEATRRRGNVQKKTDKEIDGYINREKVKEEAEQTCRHRELRVLSRREGRKGMLREVKQR